MRRSGMLLDLFYGCLTVAFFGVSLFAVRICERL